MDMMNQIAVEIAYSDGYEAGKQAALLTVQAELPEIAFEFKANSNESRYENLVVMLSDIDNVINKLLEKAYED